jgi:AcrR family transcriptional regulator
MRSDGEQNRQRLLDAAADLFAERGASVSVADIVAAAGVAAPTLYRHFGDKEGLIKTINERASETAMSRLAHALNRPTGWEGLLCAVRDNRAIRERSGVAITPSLERMLLSGWNDLVTRGHDEGSIREDFTASDVPFLFAGAAAIAAAVNYLPTLVDRYVSLLMEGIRPSPRPLPGSPPTPVEVRLAFSDAAVR